MKQFTSEMARKNLSCKMNISMGMCMCCDLTFQKVVRI